MEAVRRLRCFRYEDMTCPWSPDTCGDDEEWNIKLGHLMVGRFHGTRPGIQSSVSGGVEVARAMIAVLK